VGSIIRVAVVAGKLGGARAACDGTLADAGCSRKANRKAPRPRQGCGQVIEKGSAQLRGAANKSANPLRELPGVIVVAATTILI
jgi:hypothetical protein